MRFLSVCDGIGAVATAWKPQGFTCVATSEIEAFPISVIEARHTGAPNLGDMTRFREWPEETLAATDILCGGTPCQSFSIGGLRGGLADERGNLTLTYIHLLDRIDEARHLSGRPPALCFWENVPGVFSSADNAFGCFLAGLAGTDIPLQPPGDGWKHSGLVLGPKRAIAWRVLDAQFFGLAQRRERVFLVAGPRDGPDPAKILFEFNGLRRDSPPRREQGEGPAGNVEESAGGRCLPPIAGPLGAGTGDAGRRTTDLDGSGAFIPEIAEPLTARPYADRGPDGNLFPEIARCVTKGEGQRNDWETCTIIPCPEAGNPCPPVPAKGDAVAFSQRERGDDGRGYDRPPQVYGDHTGALETMKPPCVAIAHVDEVSPTLTAGPTSKASHGKHSGSDRGAMVAFKASHFTRGKDGAPNTVTPPLTADADRGDQDTLVLAACSVALRGREGGNMAELGDDVSTTLRAGSGGSDKAHVLVNYAVRRLTPRECERLQGFPDDYTAIARRGKPAEECADSPRYKAIGNSMAVPVIAWIGARLKPALETWHKQWRRDHLQRLTDTATAADARPIAAISGPCPTCAGKGIVPFMFSDSTEPEGVDCPTCRPTRP